MHSSFCNLSFCIVPAAHTLSSLVRIVILLLSWEVISLIGLIYSNAADCFPLPGGFGLFYLLCELWNVTTII